MTLKPWLIGLALFATAASAPAQAQPQATYSLTCRGGPAMGVAISPGDRGRNIVALQFQAAGAAAGNGAGLKPGECAWADRSLFPAEPRVVRLLNLAAVRLEAPAGLNGGVQMRAEPGAPLLAALAGSGLFTLSASNNPQLRVLDAVGVSYPSGAGISKPAQFQASTALQETYPLLCRVSPGMGLVVTPGENGRSIVDLRVQAAAAPIGAGQFGDTLKAGECAWTDRSLSPSEPRIVRLRSLVAIHAHAPGGVQGPVELRAGSAVKGEDTSAFPFLGALSQSKVIRLTAFNTRLGVLEAVAMSYVADPSTRPPSAEEVGAR